MAALFRIKKPAATDAGLRAYWIESTAPLNVDDADNPTPLDPDLIEVPPEQAITEMAEFLNRQEAPEIVVSVHGFNNPLSVVTPRFKAAYEFITHDAAIKSRMNLVCIGYRWPSEQMGRPARSVFSATPLSLIWLLVAALLLLGIGTLLTIGAFHTLPERTIWRSLSYTFCGLLLAIPVTVFFLRIAVYFRDAYRAAHYGVPDLVEVIRQLDKAANQPTPGRIRQARIKISFIGHSMGAFVVTNLVRILSDVFDPASIGTLSTDDPHKAPGPEIGNVFTLGRLVLVSPDIPAETLLLRRANFLASSLRRFEESYLFSSEGDEALRLISTMANYFSFPTKSRDNGFRMGNTEVVSPDYGIVNLERLSQESPTGEAQAFLDQLRVGRLTLAELSRRHLAPRAGSQGASDVSLLPALFSYFDCTDYIEDGRGVMTFAKCKPQLSSWDNLWLLFAYLFRQQPDVHSGYFYAPYSQLLIYRLSCLGINGLLAPLGLGTAALTALSEQCRAHQIQMLLSPVQFAAITGAMAQDRVFEQQARTSY